MYVYIYIWDMYIYVGAAWSVSICSVRLLELCSCHETSVCLHSLSLLNCLQGNGETVLNI